MSELGLHSNIYHSARTYLDLLNNFLVEVNYAKEIGEPYKNDDVLIFFNKLSDRTAVDPENQMFRSFFNSYYKNKHKNTENELNNIAQHIRNTDINDKILKEIEDLVGVLKYQCAQSFARMKGIK